MATIVVLALCTFVFPQHSQIPSHLDVEALFQMPTPLFERDKVELVNKLLAAIKGEIPLKPGLNQNQMADVYRDRQKAFQTKLRSSLLADDIQKLSVAIELYKDYTSLRQPYIQKYFGVSEKGKDVYKFLLDHDKWLKDEIAKLASQVSYPVKDDMTNQGKDLQKKHKVKLLEGMNGFLEPDGQRKFAFMISNLPDRDFIVPLINIKAAGNQMDKIRKANGPPRIYRYCTYTWLLSSPDVLVDLKLPQPTLDRVQEQIKQFEADSNLLQSDHDAIFRTMDTGFSSLNSTYSTAIGKLGEQCEAKIVTFLTPTQRERLEQIVNQVYVSGRLSTTNRARLKFTDAQDQMKNELRTEYSRTHFDEFRKHPANEVPARSQFGSDKVIYEKVLTDEQKKEWAKMIGKPLGDEVVLRIAIHVYKQINNNW